MLLIPAVRTLAALCPTNTFHCPLVMAEPTLFPTPTDSTMPPDPEKA